MSTLIRIAAWTAFAGAVLTTLAVVVDSVIRLAIVAQYAAYRSITSEVIAVSFAVVLVGGMGILAYFLHRVLKEHQ